MAWVETTTNRGPRLTCSRPTFGISTIWSPAPKVRCQCRQVVNANWWVKSNAKEVAQSGFCKIETSMAVSRPGSIWRSSHLLQVLPTNSKNQMGFALLPMAG